MTYTIKKLAKLANVSVRTLHYYDQIGLLKPSFVSENGYRHYEEKELLKLQQILFFRELEFPLQEIKEILKSDNFDVEKALKDHKKLLEMKQERLDNLINTINNTLTNWIPDQAGNDRPALTLQMANKKGKIMKDEELFEGFDEKKMEEFKQEAKERWGHTDAYKQSAQRTKNYTKDDFVRIAKEWDAIAKAYVANMNKGFDSPEVQAVVQTHWDQINKFYDCTVEIFTGLGQMYVADERFANNYRKYHQGLPEFIQKAINYYCENK